MNRKIYSTKRVHRRQKEIKSPGHFLAGAFEKKSAYLIKEISPSLSYTDA
jgi:hypothetical protein